MTKNLKYRLMFALLQTACVLLSCRPTDEPKPSPQPDPEPEKPFFAKGADISWATEMEAKGYKFYNAAGEERECTALMKELGFNAVRYRVWVNPTNGYNSKKEVLVKALRAKNLGMKVMIDFHYSDSWADPGKQYKPEAWADLSLADLMDAVVEHTRETLSLLKANGVDVAWIQIGNEVDNGMLWETCRVKDQSASAFVQCFNAAAAAAKGVFPEAQIVMHIGNGWDTNVSNWFFDLMKTNGANYDIIGLSLYPSYWQNGAYPDWKSKTQASVKNVSMLHIRYGCPVMIAEVGMPAAEPDNAKEMLQYLFDSTKDLDFFSGIFYWEPESEHSRNGYDYGAFVGGKPTQALDPFQE